MKFIIDHERYGQRAEFSTIAEAQAGLRACGPDFKGTRLTWRGSEIFDERGDVVGSVELDATDNRQCDVCGSSPPYYTLALAHVEAPNDRLDSTEVCAGCLPMVAPTLVGGAAFAESMKKPQA